MRDVIATIEEIEAHAVPRRVGAWAIDGVLGEGGMGVVYRATRADGVFEREVALKRLGPGIGPDLARRLGVERQALARLEHDGIAGLYDSGVDDEGAPFLVMERVDGEPITSHADRAGLDVPARMRLFISVCEAVAYAHQHLVVHRDLKPSNVFFTPEGRPKLLDFGVAKLLDPSGTEENDFTLAGSMTPGYAAPEQIRGETVTTATDVYYLGVLLYELLSGRRPRPSPRETIPARSEAISTRLSRRRWRRIQRDAM
jgi:serine/threonine protein kinase